MNRRAGSGWASGLVLLVVLVAVAIAAMLLVPRALGYHAYIVEGESMAGTIEKGSLVYTRTAPVADLRVGDIITYRPPPGAQARSQLVTHRIVSVSRDEQGRRVLVTKGDANPVRDPWTFTLDRSVQARYAFDLPYLGRVYDALSVTWVRVLVLALPALAVGIALLLGAWRDAGEEAARRRGGPDRG